MKVILRKITNKKVKLFRPPFGSYNNDLISACESLNLLPIHWDVDTLDWKGISATEILERVKKSVKNGSIILCHNNSDHILEALTLMISYLKEQGYQMVKISELVYESDYIVDNNGLQKSKKQ